MAFCGNCGAQLEGNERFCVKCGRDTTLQAAAPAASAPVASAAPPPVQPIAAMPPGAYAAPPGAIPVAMMPPQAQQKRGGTMGLIIVLAALAAVGYYYYTHHKPITQGSSGGTAAALGKLQVFVGSWQNVNGFVQITNGTWKNNANVAVQTATVQCIQYDGSGNLLDEMNTTMTGPVAPGNTANVNQFNAGAAAANLSSVKCTVTYAHQVSGAQ